MPVHFVCADPIANELGQGDILRHRYALVEALSKSHPPFAGESFRFFSVLTQSCDLVRRNGKPPNAKFISVCAARPLIEILRYKATEWQQSWEQSARIIDHPTHDKLMLFTESLLDNNQDGYFYLHEDASAGIDGRYCCILRLSVPISSQEYDTLLGEKLHS